jgi:uncharacterized protein (TIGR02453 family)
MDIKRINKYLKAIAANNSREWFHEHKAEYDACRKDFEAGVEQLILALTKNDSTIANVTAKEACFRFYRDIRFSPDKRPYKEHFGAYISAHGRKSLHAGYYLHLQPGKCLLSAGAYWLPTNILTSCRNEIIANIDEWRRCVEGGEFVKLFGYAGEADWETSPKGFGLSSLKTCPSGFPKDYEHIRYLRMKDYCVWHHVDDDFFKQSDWASRAAKLLNVAKPMMDFTNSVIDDYE